MILGSVLRGAGRSWTAATPWPTRPCGMHTTARPVRRRVTGEKRAFEEAVDFISERLERRPGMHVHHYNHHEPTSVDRLSGSQLSMRQRWGAVLRVRAVSASGRGAQLSGGPAQLRLMPSSSRTHPASGKRGDLFVDKSGRLWFCKGNTNWKQLA